MTTVFSKKHTSFFFKLLDSKADGLLKGFKYEPPSGKTNNVVSEQVRHKPACTSTEKS